MALVKYNNNSISAITAAASIPTGAMNLITTNTISSGVSSSSFTSSIDSTYDTYIFKWINIHPSAGSNAQFQVNFRDGSSAFDATKTTTKFEAYHAEADGNALQYQTGQDLAQSTAYQSLNEVGNSADDCMVGELYLFEPSSDTFVKHFISRTQSVNSAVSKDNYIAGYCNVTAAIDGVDFKFSSGNIDSGVIKMYGLSKS